MKNRYRQTCNCRSCYASSVGLTSEAVDNWRGRTKCLLDRSFALAKQKDNAPKHS